jgi:hypothetical protein
MEKSQMQKAFKQMFQMKILSMIGAQFYMSFKFKHESKGMVFSTSQGGSTLMKSKQLVINQNHHINQVKMVSGQPTKPPDTMMNHSRIEESKSSSLDPFNNLFTLHLIRGISMMLVRLQVSKSYQLKFN